MSCTIQIPNTVDCQVKTINCFIACSSGCCFLVLNRNILKRLPKRLAEPQMGCFVGKGRVEHGAPCWQRTELPHALPTPLIEQKYNSTSYLKHLRIFVQNKKKKDKRSKNSEHTLSKIHAKFKCNIFLFFFFLHLNKNRIYLNFKCIPGAYIVSKKRTFTLFNRPLHLCASAGWC